MANVWNSAIGGCLLSLCVIAFSAFYGRVVGISGIVNNAIFKRQIWQSFFMGGMLLIGFFQPMVKIQADIVVMSVGGILVGAGVTMGNGCTSGHGLCGLARLSKRSIVAVLTFMGSAMITRLFINDISSIRIEYENSIEISATNKILLCITGIGSFLGFYNSKRLHMGFVSWFAGMVFGLGLSIGGMIYPEKIFGFLNLLLAVRDPLLFPFIDPSLAVVFACGLLPNLLVHPAITNLLDVPISGCKWNFPHSTIVDFKLILGSVLFGVGWGIAGLCPGPGVVLLPQVILYGNIPLLCWWIGLLTGMYLVMKLPNKPLKVAVK